MATTNIGVRDLVQFTLRSGDLNQKLNSQNTTTQGARIHRQLQKRHRETNYQSEVALKQLVEINGRQYLINGRADGVVAGKVPLIEEIKTSDVAFNALPESIKTLYWAQVKVYAHLLMEADERVQTVKIQLTYVQTPDQIKTKQTQTITRTEAAAYFQSLIDEYKQWLELRAQIAERRIASAKQLQFPFAQFRPGQRKFASVVYKTVALQRHLFAEAPTGTGKTISTLFPTVKAMGEQLVDSCLYLTAKQSTRHVAEAALTLLGEHGLQVKSITLTAKEQIEFASERDLAPEDNPYMLGYYDRLKPALKAVLATHDQITRAVVEKYAEQYTLDPFEFSLDLSEFCSVIICDYNYVFDPQVRLARFFTATDDQRCLLVDEAHNLVDRARDMYSAQIDNAGLKQLIKALTGKPQNDAVVKTLRSLSRSMAHYYRKLGKEHKDSLVFTEPLTNVVKIVTDATRAIHKWLAKQEQLTNSGQAVLDYYLTLLTYLNINDRYDQAYYRTRVVRSGTVLTIKQLCLDPSDMVAETLQLSGSTVFFSATLSPMDYYQRCLGNEDDSLAFQLPSPFPIDNQLVVCAPFINPAYKMRSGSIDPICATIDQVQSEKPGHYLFFFPSFAYLDQVATRLQQRYPEIDPVIQTRQMDPAARQTFLNAFTQDPTHPVVGLAILGGIFAEGVDLPGNQLIGVGIVSVGLPGLNEETDLIRDYFQAENGAGFKYAYQLPGFNHVVQAAGRLIRTAQDVGVTILMDPRFSTARYRALFPANWQHAITARSKADLAHQVARFWQTKGADPHR